MSDFPDPDRILDTQQNSVRHALSCSNSTSLTNENITYKDKGKKDEMQEDSGKPPPHSDDELPTMPKKGANNGDDNSGKPKK